MKSIVDFDYRSLVEEALKDLTQVFKKVNDLPDEGEMVLTWETMAQIHDEVLEGHEKWQKVFSFAVVQSMAMQAFGYQVDTFEGQEVDLADVIGFMHSLAGDRQVTLMEIVEMMAQELEGQEGSVEWKLSVIGVGLGLVVAQQDGDESGDNSKLN